MLKRSGLGAVQGAWVPNWRFDVICVDAALADGVRARFSVTLLPVRWPRAGLAPAYQLRARVTDDPWFDREQLSAAARERHGTDGAHCPDCGTWRWMPLGVGALPPLRVDPEQSHSDLVASPEWFGDGCQSFRQLLVRRELGELLAGESPRDLRLHEPQPS